MPSETYTIAGGHGKEQIHMGLTVGKRNLFMVYQTAKGDIGRTMLTKSEVADLMLFLHSLYEQMQWSRTRGKR